MSVYILRQTTKGGQTRYRVRWKHGRYGRVVYLGSFARKGAAELRKRWAEDEIASGRAPALPNLAAPRRVTMRAVAEEWLERRVDVAAETRRNDAASVKAIVERFGPLDPAMVTTDDVQAWFRDLLASYAVGTVRLRRIVLGQVLDFADVDPNPAKSRKVTLPRRSRVWRDLPTRPELVKLRAELPDPYGEVVDFLEHAGLRVSEAVALRHEDIDHKRGRFLVSGKTGTRWVEVLDGKPTLPPKGGRGRVWPGVTDQTVRGALRRASDRAKVRHTTPHMCRHLHITRLMASGRLPAAEIAARVGDTPGTIIGTYLHRLPPD